MANLYFDPSRVGLGLHNLDIHGYAGPTCQKQCQCDWLKV